jgi:hypothetical protein
MDNVGKLDNLNQAVGAASLASLAIASPASAITGKSPAPDGRSRTR